jgi:hypothetical protein
MSLKVWERPARIEMVASATNAPHPRFLICRATVPEGHRSVTYTSRDALLAQRWTSLGGYSPHGGGARRLSIPMLSSRVGRATDRSGQESLTHPGSAADRLVVAIPPRTINSDHDDAGDRRAESS